MARPDTTWQGLAGWGPAWFPPLGILPGGGAFLMDRIVPKHRPPTRIWRRIGDHIYCRDRGLCSGPYCRQHGPYPRHQIHVDHIKSGKLANNKFKNLRLLCRRCHVLRLDQRHRGMIASALRDGIIPPDWRRFCWDNDLWPAEEIISEMVQWISSQETISEL